MGSRYLVELGDVLRAAGCTVSEIDGWQSRSRSSGGYDGAPWAVYWHHTASSDDGPGDAQYCCYSADAKPVCNLVIGWDGTVYVCAAGATNTNGSGGPYGLPDGRTIPVDSANSRVVGIEISNNGVGARYPQAQVDACFKASNAVAVAYIDGKVDNVVTHQAWTDRKIDPATASAVEGGWQPGSVTSSGTWSLSDLRAECVRRAAGTLPAPQPDEGDDDMTFLTYDANSGWWVMPPGLWSKQSVGSADKDAIAAAGGKVIEISNDLLLRIPTTYNMPWQPQ